MPTSMPPARGGRPGEPAPPFDPLGTFKVPAIHRPRPGASVPGTAGTDPRRAESTDRADVLIVGNGIAGCIAAMDTREYAPDASVLIVTAQNHPTINTPALKQYGAGRLELEQLLAYPAGTEQELGIGVINDRATRFDPARRQVQLASGRSISYRRLLLATGAYASGLPAGFPGADFDGVLTLHTLADYLNLRRRLPETEAAVVIGGGYHAAETAMMLRHHRLHVTWLIRGRGLLPQTLDVTASELLLRQVRRQGVEVRLETEIAGIVGRMGTVAGVVTTDGDFIPCDLVVPATGVQPDVALAEEAGLELLPRQGVRVNERLQTTAPNVFAAGAVAAVLNPQTGRHEARGLWYFAVQQGRLAAAAMTGAPVTEQASAGALGNFWHATQFDRLSVLVAGAPMLTERDHPDNEVLTNGSGSFYRRIVVRHDRLVGYLAVGTGKGGGLAIKRLIDERITVREIKRKLLSEDFDVRSFFTARRIHALQTGDVQAVPAPTAARSRQLTSPWQTRPA
jgi:NAD(P)H-nitrite reductase large subunit